MSGSFGNWRERLWRPVAGDRIERDEEWLVADQGLVVGVALAVYALAVALILGRPLVPSIVAVPPIVVALSLVPGLLALLAVTDVERIDARVLVYAFGLSLFLLMMLGLLVNVALPGVGIDRPLSVGPLLASISLLVGGLATVAVYRRRGTTVETFVASPISPLPMALALLPLLSVLGVSLLNQTGNNLLLVLALIAVATVPLVMALVDGRRWHSFGIWTMALAVLFHDALYVSKTFPGNPVVVRIWRAGRWVPGTVEGGPLSTELLQHGTIFPMFAILNDVNIMTQMILVNPFFVSFLPVVLFVAFRQYLPARTAFVTASIFVFAHPFYNQYTTAGRAATPVIFLALFALVLAESDFSRPLRSVLGLFFLASVVFTHYGTAYYTLMAVGGAVVANLVLKAIDFSVASTRLRKYLSRGLDGTSARRGEPSLLSLPLLGFYTVLIFSWFAYTNGGRAFALLPRHAADSLDQFLSGSAGLDAGRTAARLQRDYGAPAITYSKMVYLLIGLLVAVGLLVTLVRRFKHSEEYRLHDHFFVLGGVMLGIFGITLIVRTWGGGRPMMITFVFTLLFAAIGVMWIGDVFTAIAGRLVGEDRPSPITRDRVVTGFAVAVGLLLILNSGVASALVLTGSAPSSIPLQDGQTDWNTDLETHAWMVDRYEDGNVYGDNTAFVHTDAKAPAIAAATADGRQYGPERPRGDVTRLADPGHGPGFLLLLSHNVKTQRLQMYLDREPLDLIRPEYRENLVYTTGESEIYFFDGS